MTKKLVKAIADEVLTLAHAKSPDCAGRGNSKSKKSAKGKKGETGAGKECASQPFNYSDIRSDDECASQPFNYTDIRSDVGNTEKGT